MLAPLNDLTLVKRLIWALSTITQLRLFTISTFVTLPTSKPSLINAFKSRILTLFDDQVTLSNLLICQAPYLHLSL